MTELNQEQHIQLLQFMGLLQNCKTENEMQKLKVEYYDIPKYSFLQDFIPEKEKDENLSSYKTNLIYKMDKYQQDYKFVYGENFPAYKKQTIPENKADYTVSNLLDEISECEDIEAYQKLLSEKNRFPKVRIEAISSDITGIYFSNGLPGNIVWNSPKNIFNARKQLVEAGYSPFTLPSVEDVRENGFDWLHEEISHFKESLNPNFIEQETQMNQEPEFNEQEYEEVYDDFIEQMDANSGMSSMAAEADYNASLVENEDIDDVQRQMDIDNGLIDENGNEILYDDSENEERKTIKAIDVWNEIYETIAEDPEYQAIKFTTLDYLYNKSTDDMAGYENSFERNILRLVEVRTIDINVGKVLEKYKDFKIDFDDNALAVKIAGSANNNFDKAKQDLLDFVESKKYLRESEISQNVSDISQDSVEDVRENGNEILYDGPKNEQEENFEEYIHSEEFITKFGDWEKANRLEKLRNAESIIKDGKITLNNSDITETVESLIDNEDRRGLQSLEKEIGKNILGVYVNPDTGLTINVSNRNVTEISNHHYLFKEHIQSLSFIPEIIDKAILIGEVENEDKQKHPNIEKYLYFGTGIKIDGVDYTCKSVVGIDKNNNCYYDQSLSTIEKGRLVDYIFKNEKVGNLSPLITQRETDLEGNDLPYVYYDKRLINICQVPQMPYLEKNTITGKWQPTKEAVEAVKNGALFVEKQGQNYVMNDYMMTKQTATNYVLEKLSKAGIEVVTNKEEFDRILGREAILQKMSGSLSSEEQKRYFTFDEEDSQKFIEHVKEWQNDNTNPSKLLVVGKIPPVMKILGISDKPIEVEQSTLDKMIRDEPTYPNDRQGHKLSLDDIYAIPSQLADPIMVFKSRTRSDSFVFFTERKDKNNNSILIPLAVNKKKGKIIINEITSMYGKDNEIDFVEKNINENNLIYADKKRSLDWERSSQIQFLTQRFSNPSFDLSILTKERLVNFLSADSRTNNIQKMVLENAGEKNKSSNGERFTQIQFLRQRFTDNGTYDLNISQNEEKSSLQNMVSDGITYGFTHEGKIYLNPDVMNSNAAVHEYTHLWDAYTQKTNPELWLKGLNIFKDTNYWKEVINDPNYQDIKDDENLVLSEIHGRICGKMAEKVLEKIAELDGKQAKFDAIDWNVEVNEFIAEEFGIRPELGTENYISDSLKASQLNEFLSAPMKDLFINEKELKITNKIEKEFPDTSKNQEKEQQVSEMNINPQIQTEVTNTIEHEQRVSIFDKELQDFIDGKLPKSHIFSLGKPSEILVKCGFPAEQRIELSVSHLEFKSKLPRYTFNLEEIKGLEKALQNPIAVFEYGDRKKSQNIIINIEKDGKNFLTGVHFNQSKRGYEVSDIRTLYPKENVEWLNWINQGKMIYGNKEKLQALIAQQRINVAEVNSQIVQSPLHEHCLESCSSILDKFGEVKDIFADEYPFYEDVKKKAAIEQKFFNYYVTKGNLDARELSVFESEEFYNALISGDAAKIDEYTNTDLHEINELAVEIYEEYSKDNEIENTQKVSDLSQDSISNIFDTPTDSMKVNESLNTEFSNNDIPVENNEVEQEPEPQNEPQNYENNNSNVSAPKPKNKQELHQFFINNPYTSGTPVPTIAMRNEQTGHSTFIEGYEFARFEDIGNENPAFKDENEIQIKPDGQTVVLTKPAFKEVIDEETGEKKLVPDENNRKFIKISRDLYEQAIKNSEIIAKRNPKTKQEKEQMIADYEEAAHLDEKKQRDNTADNFWHNYQAGVMTFANNKQEAMAFAKRLVNEMIPSERAKFANMVNNYEKIKGADDKHLSYDQRILERYEDITKGLQITNKSIWRDHIDKKFDVLDAIKRNTEVFDKEGQPLDKTCRMKIGDTIKMSITVDSALSNKKIKLPLQDFRLVAHSKDNNSVALISVDGKQKIFKNREDFIKQVQKIEKKQIKKQQRQDKYESISM